MDMSEFQDPMHAVAAEPPDIAPSAIAAVVSDQFGLKGDLQPLISERDQNFCLKTDTGERFVVKIVGLTEDPDVTDFQIEALLHLQQASFSGVPRVVRTLKGEIHSEIALGNNQTAVMRVVTWLAGETLMDVAMTPALLQQFGRCLASLDKALHGFRHVGENQVLLWDMQRAMQLRELFVHVNDSALRDMLGSVLNDFEARVQPRLTALPRQVIHSDANTENVLVNKVGEIAGFIDFGDMLRSARIIEVATAASYLRSSDDPLRLIRPFLDGYHFVAPLEDTEYDVLFDLIRTRLCMTLTILHWRVAARDVDDPYRIKALAGEATAADFLSDLNALGHDGFAIQIRQ